METTGLKYTSEIDIAWAAGLFEGEGCLSQRKGDDRWCLEILMTDKDVLEKFADLLGLTINGPYETKNTRGTGVKWKDHYRVGTSARDKVFKIVCEIYPYLCARRREKCDEFIAWYEAKQ